MAKGAVGTHFLIEFYGCDARRLNDERFLRRAVSDTADAAGLNVVGIISHKFKPRGVTVVAALSESHLSLHTWPETRYCAADIFTCSPKSPAKAVSLLARTLRAERKKEKKLARG